MSERESDHPGKGTAASEVMDYFGLESAEKAVILGMVTRDTWRVLKTTTFFHHIGAVAPIHERFILTL